MSRVDLSGVNEMAIQISAICPGCGQIMHYDKQFLYEGAPIKRVHCTDIRDSDCPEKNKLWDLDMRTGMAKRVQP